MAEDDRRLRDGDVLAALRSACFIAGRYRDRLDAGCARGPSEGRRVAPTASGVRLCWQSCGLPDIGDRRRRRDGIDGGREGITDIDDAQRGASGYHTAGCSRRCRTSTHQRESHQPHVFANGASSSFDNV